MKQFPTSARRLHRHSMRIGSQAPVPGSIFPFFNREGEVTSLMITTANSSEVYAAAWEPGLIRVPLFGPIRIGNATYTLCPLRPESIDMLASVWHFDPWWVLAEPPFEGHWAVPALKRTNCVHGLAKHHVNAVYFSRDVSRVCGVLVRDGGDRSLRRWNVDWLPDAPPSSPHHATQPARAGSWRLAPVWDPGRRRARVPGTAEAGDA